jgi:hypothetical protein
MATFTPPVAQDIPPILPESRGDARRLFRYYPSRKRYIAVFKLSNGTYVQDTASPENSNTNIPYPWNPDQPSAPYVSSKYYDYTLGQYVTEELSISPYILFVYLGVTTVSSTEAAALTAAGYGDCIS